MTRTPRDAVITGIGLVSCLGDGLAAHQAALYGPGRFRPVVDQTRFAPYPVHPMAALPLDTQIPKRGDQRQMEPWQRIGTYAAGLALEQAGVKGDAALLARTDMIVAAGGGERDYAADAAILAALPDAADPGALLNQRLLADLRPTLFLAQLSNLLAGNISIVHGVVGSSRTFMGEEASGADALRIACARIAAGQGDLFLVGGSYNAERADSLLLMEMGGGLLAGDFAGIWGRQGRGGGMVLGSVGAFLVLESRAHAEARGAAMIARIAAIAADRGPRSPERLAPRMDRLLAPFRAALDPADSAIVTAACGTAAPTQAEAAALAPLGLPMRAAATAFGHSLEAAYPAALALGALAVQQARLFAPLEDAAQEPQMESALARVLVSGFGQWRGEALALLERA
ncbi:MAG: beta-ketoacyl-ACP synthase [Rhodospirillales bacterium]|nr:beta-ketoacyl-ACP synthase [Rhodospirillales bacterium]